MSLILWIRSRLLHLQTPEGSDGRIPPGSGSGGRIPEGSRSLTSDPMGLGVFHLRVWGFLVSTCLLYKPIMVASIRNMHRVFAFRGITVFSGGLSRSIRLSSTTGGTLLIYNNG